MVVGLTAPRSESSVDAVETLSNRSAEAERRELVREQSLEIVRESLELVRESLELQEQEHESAEAAPATTDEGPVTSRVETLTFDLPQAFRDAAADSAVNIRAIESVKQADADSSSPVVIASPTPSEAHALSMPTPDEMSIPPMGDLSVEPIADRFFSEGELVAARHIDAMHDADHEEWDERAHTSVRKSLPEVVQRRARFAKYVRWAVGGAAVVCLAALARTALPTSAPAESPLASSRAALEAREAPVAKAAAAAVEAEPVAAPVVAVPAPAPAALEPAKVTDPEPAAAPATAGAEAPVAAAAAATNVAASAAAAPAAVAPAAVAPAADKTALQEKNDARRALERGKVADAIAAGERSVALDATDGEAWLLLGAAYQEKGNNAEARRCYTACIKEGKRGPVGECRAMLR